MNLYIAMHVTIAGEWRQSLDLCSALAGSGRDFYPFYICYDYAQGWLSSAEEGTSGLYLLHRPCIEFVWHNTKLSLKKQK